MDDTQNPGNPGDTSGQGGGATPQWDQPATPTAEETPAPAPMPEPTPVPSQEGEQSVPEASPSPETSQGENTGGSTV